MKNLVSLFVVIFFLSSFINAQDTMFVHQNDGQIVKFAINEIDSVIFYDATILNSTDCGTVTDFDGNIYNTVKIGNQCWMKENLKVKHWSDGTALSYSYYNNNANNEADIYGALYTWDMVMKFNDTVGNYSNPSGVQGICPLGWHVPSLPEWIELTDFIGVNSGCKLAGKSEVWTDGKLDSNIDFGKSGFSAVPGGWRYLTSDFMSGGCAGHWWSTSTDNYTHAQGRSIYCNELEMSGLSTKRGNSISVRCVKD